MNLPTAKTNWIDNTIEDYSEKAKLIAEYIPLRLYIFHICVLVIFYLLFMITGLIRDFPSSSNLLQWDTTWYQKIVLHGYVYKSHAQCSLAFFPLFPFFWAALHISTFGMSIINLIMMFAGLTLLTHCIHIPARTLLLILSTPSMFFCYVPYSEALFFFTSCLFLYGLKYDKLYMAITGMALASMTRSASTMFIPVIIISFLLNYRRATWQGDLKKMILLLITAIGAVILVCFIQYCQTGYWFKFFETQRYWGREFNIPGLFLTTWGEWSWTWLDGSAFFVCTVCFAGLVYLFIRKKRNTTKMIDPVFLFSIGYLAMAMLMVLFFGPQDNSGYGTSVYSLNRFVFATPFFAVFLTVFLRHIRLEFKTILIFLMLADMVGFLFGAFTGMDRSLYWTLTFMYSFLYIWYDKSIFKKEIWTGLYIVNIIFQLWMFNSFLHGGGVL